MYLICEELKNNITKLKTSVHEQIHCSRWGKIIALTDSKRFQNQRQNDGIIQEAENGILICNYRPITCLLLIKTYICGEYISLVKNIYSSGKEAEREPEKEIDSYLSVDKSVEIFKSRLNVAMLRGGKKQEEQQPRVHYHWIIKLEFIWIKCFAKIMMGTFASNDYIRITNFPSCGNIVKSNTSMSELDGNCTCV